MLAGTERVSFDQLSRAEQYHVTSLAALHDETKTEFYPILAKALYDALKEDISYFCGLLLKQAFSTPESLKRASQDHNQFSIFLLFFLLSSEHGPFNTKNREKLALHPSHADNIKRDKLLKEFIKTSDALLFEVLSPLHREVYLCDTDAVISQFLQLIKQRIPILLSDENKFPQGLRSFIKSELQKESFASLKASLEKEMAMIDFEKSMPTLVQDIVERWELLLTKLLPLKERVNLHLAFFSFMAKEFPENSPRQHYFKRLQLNLKDKYSAFLNALLEAKTAEAQTALIEKMGRKLHKCMKEEANREIGYQTPLSRLESKIKSDDKQKGDLEQILQHVLQEGADPNKLSYRRKFYHRIMAFLEYFYLFPKKTAKAPLSANPEQVKPATSHHIKIESKNPSGLLYFFSGVFSLSRSSQNASEQLRQKKQKTRAVSPS